MTQPDSSPIADFYPATFETDANGKRNSWEHTVLLGFVRIAICPTVHHVPALGRCSAAVAIAVLQYSNGPGRSACAWRVRLYML